MNWKNQIEKLGENFKAEKKNSILKLANKKRWAILIEYWKKIKYCICRKEGWNFRKKRAKNVQDFKKNYENNLRKLSK